MMEYMLIAGFATICALATVTFFFKVNLIPMLITALIVLVGVNPLVYSVGSNIDKADKTTFNEYWNGYEVSASADERNCTRDGNCSHVYDCDPYTKLVSKTRSVTRNGKTTTEHYTTTETHYHSCPYSKTETTFSVNSTIQSFTIASRLMTGEPYRAYHAIPGGRQGAPQEWLSAKARLDAGIPGPVTAVHSYTNYLLANKKSVFAEYAGNISDYKAKNLLPQPSAGVFNTYQSTKAYRVGNANVPLFGEYITDMSYLNGAVGNDLHGDLHVVFVPENIDGGKDMYFNSLLAYWDSEELQRDAISKNSIIVAIGVSADGQKVAWAKAGTGMPMGNEALLTQIASDLTDKPLDKNLLGCPNYNLATSKVMASHGELENILWGANKFNRVSMTAKDANDNGSGFSYLGDEIQPESAALVWIGIVNFLLAGGVIAGAIALIVNNVFPRKFATWRNTPNSQK